MSQTNFTAKDLIQKGMSGTTPQQKAGKIVIGTILFAVIMTILYVTLPYIKLVFNDIAAIANDILRTCIYALIGVAIFAFVKAQWRNIGYLNDAMARRVFNGIITYDPFLIQEKQILSAEHDVEKMMEEKAVIEGKYTELAKKIKAYEIKRDAAKESNNIVLNQLRMEKDPAKAKILELDSNDCVRKELASQNYITSIAPIANDMKFMIDFISEGYQVLKRRIAGAKEELVISKDTYESANAGAEALARMKRAMVGDIQLNNDAERATVAVMQRTAMLVGQMKLSMEIISDVTRSSNLEESGQLALARKKLENLNLLGDGSITSTNLALPAETANFQGTMQLKDVQLDFNKLPE